MAAPALILASQSPWRRGLLEKAGVIFAVRPAQVDESEIKRACQADGASALDAAEALAELKARRISQQEPEALVIGADQILVCGEIWFDKPGDRDHARGHLRALSGKTHHLATVACALRGGQRLWHHRADPALTMRALSDDFISGYLEAAGDEVLQTVGAYAFEGLGAQLFSKVEGDFFTILGLPLLPLLAFLREQGVVPR